MINLKDNGWTGFLVVLLALAVLVTASGCGTLLNGSVPEEMRGEVDGLALILNLLIFLPGIIVDVITGGFWMRKAQADPAPRTP